MPISRRVFIKTASITAIAATVGKPAVVAFAQDTIQPGASTTDPLAYYTQATFTQYISSIFRLHGFRTVEVVLEKVQDTLPATVARTGGRESFVLYFRGGAVQLPQDTYSVEHPALGNFRLFLVPNGADEYGAQSYVATINRLGYTAKPAAAPKAVPRRSVPTSTPKTESPAPAKVTPETKTPGPAETSKPPARGKPRIRKVDPERSLEFDYQ